MISIRLPDGSQRSFDAPPRVADVAAAIGPGLAKAALAGRVDGKLVDTSYRIDRDADLAIVTDRDADGLEILRHSTAHLLAYAVKELYPEAQVTIGPVIENGFYYDFSFARGFTPEDLVAIENKMAPSSSSSRSARSTRRRSSRRSRPTRTSRSIAKAASSISVAARTCRRRGSSRSSS